MCNSLDTASMPFQWKCGEITPVFKGGSTLDPKNYRPISILPKTAIVFEKFIKPLLESEVSIIDNESISVQFGFSKSKSCESNLLGINMLIAKIIDGGGTCKIVLLDLSAAFDLVPHNIIIDKLIGLGVINHRLINFMQCYLTNRKMSGQR